MYRTNKYSLPSSHPDFRSWDSVTDDETEVTNNKVLCRYQQKCKFLYGRDKCTFVHNFRVCYSGSDCRNIKTCNFFHPSYSPKKFKKTKTIGSFSYILIIIIALLVANILFAFNITIQF